MTSGEQRTSEPLGEGFAFFCWHQRWGSEACEGYGSTRGTIGLFSWCTLVWDVLQKRDVYDYR